jgi:hypothetical protein
LDERDVGRKVWDENRVRTHLDETKLNRGNEQPERGEEEEEVKHRASDFDVGRPRGRIDHVDEGKWEMEEDKRRTEAVKSLGDTLLWSRGLR